MENIRKRVNIRLVTNEVQLKRLTAKPSFHAFQPFSENLLGVHMKKVNLRLCKPIYVGFSVLDISKLVMYKFHYEEMKPRYGDKIRLCFTDTDSLLYEVKTDDIFKDMQSMIHLFDTSDYQKDHPCYSTTNKKVPGKMKDEMNGKQIREFIGLRSKMYSVLLDDGVEKKTAKGVPKQVIKKQISHADYKQSLLNTAFGEEHSCKQIRSINHQLYTLDQRKKTLCPGDDKRWILEDKVRILILLMH
jgi:hypothetical protein